ncbi:PE domain-containing protein [Pseudonocardia alni]|uniref:PE domain-containing protein n=1 Tax=Pseudonocardia alni TaxID=33907 RepID=UPI0036970D70
MSTNAEHAGVAEGLMTQISVESVMAVLALYSSRLVAAQAAVRTASDLRAIPACADDPVSQDARDLFQRKVDSIRDTHVDYVNELQKTCTDLQGAARAYGFTEDEIVATAGKAGEPMYRGSRAIR